MEKTIDWLILQDNFEEKYKIICFKLLLECIISLLKDPEQVSVSVKKLKTLFKDSSSRLAMACASITASYPLRRLGRSYKIVHVSSVSCGQLQYFLQWVLLLRETKVDCFSIQSIWFDLIWLSPNFLIIMEK